MKRLLTAALGAGLLLAAGSADAQQRPLKTVTLNYGVVAFPVNNAPIFSVPRLMGFWAEEGLEVKIEGAAGAGPALQQLLAGRVEMTFTGIPAAMELINKGAPIRIVASIYSKNTFYPAVLEDSPIRTIEDFRGKTVGLTAVASTNAMWMKAILRLHGMKPEDIRMVGSGEGAAGLQALTEKRIDALQLYEGMYDNYEAAGVKLRRFDTMPELSKLSFVQGLMVRDETIQKNPEVVIGLMRGIAKAAVFSNAQPEAAVQLHWKAYPVTKPTGVDDATAMRTSLRPLKGVLPHYKHTYEGKFGWASKESVEATRDTLHGVGELSQALPADRYFNDSFLPKVNEFDRDAIAKLPPKL